MIAISSMGLKQTQQVATIPILALVCWLMIIMGVDATSMVNAKQSLRMRTAVRMTVAI